MIKEFQEGVHKWVVDTLGKECAFDIHSRASRFCEETFEFLQTCGYPKEHIYQILEYTYSRPQGDAKEEAGDVQITFNALCYAKGIDVEESGALALERMYDPEVIAKVKAKAALKQKGSPLPGIMCDSSSDLVDILTMSRLNNTLRDNIESVFIRYLKATGFDYEGMTFSIYEWYVANEMVWVRGNISSYALGSEVNYGLPIEFFKNVEKSLAEARSCYLNSQQSKKLTKSQEYAMLLEQQEAITQRLKELSEIHNDQSTEG